MSKLHFVVGFCKGKSGSLLHNYAIGSRELAHSLGIDWMKKKSKEDYHFEVHEVDKG